MKNVNIGDLITVPYGDHIALAHIVWISKKMKNIIGIVIYNINYNDGDSMDIDSYSPLYIELPIGKIATLYADIRNVKNGLWEIIGHKDIDSYNKFITHSIGGDLYVGDAFVRHLDSSEYNVYRKVLSSPNKAVEVILTKFLEKYI